MSDAIREAVTTLIREHGNMIKAEIDNNMSELSNAEYQKCVDAYVAADEAFGALLTTPTTAGEPVALCALCSVPWPPRDVLAQLAHAADILLNEYSYSRDQWEQMHAALRQARVILATPAADQRARGTVTDAQRLDWLQQQVAHPNYWHDVMVCWDHEDGVWIQTVRKGEVFGEKVLTRYEHTSDIRAAIDAALHADAARTGEVGDGE